MGKFFSKNKVIVFIIVAAITVFISVVVGNNIANTMKAKEKQAEKSVVEEQKNEKKEIAKKNTPENKPKEEEDKKTSNEIIENGSIEDQVQERVEIAKKIEKVKTASVSNTNNYSQEYEEYLNLSDEDKAKVEAVPRKENIDYSELENIIEDQKEDIKQEDKKDDEQKESDDKKGEDKSSEEESEQEQDDDIVLPERFNLKDEISIKVEDQGGFGLCWDFAAIKCVETNLALTQGKKYDLSESHVDYMASNLMTLSKREANCGGNFSDMKNYNQAYRGFATEEEVPLNVYDDYEYNTFYNTPLESLYITKYVDFPTVNKNTQEDYENRFKELQTAVKTHIMKYGSVYASIATPYYGENHYTKDKEDLKDNDGSHSISIVGWDDNYSRDNFKSPNGNVPEKDGAYIALNSWGEKWADGGYFYISYEDFKVHKEMSGVVSINKNSDLINVSKLGEKARKYAIETYSNEIVTIDGEEYLWPDVISNNLDLSNRDIDDINEFKAFINKANTINLSNNKLSNIDGIEKLIKKENVNINLSNNNIKDVSCLKDVSVSVLTLDGNNGVRGYENLNISIRLSIENCAVTSFRSSENLKNLKSLNLSGNSIADYSEVVKLSELYYVELRNCGLNSLDTVMVILEKDGLTQIDLSQNKLKNISGLENSKASIVDLSYNTEIESYELLRKSKKIYTIYLKSCDIKNAKDVLIESVTEEDIEKAEGNGYGVSLGINYILSENKGISNLGALKNAATITVENCDLGDISEIKQIKYLKEINLSNNHNLTGDLSGKSLSKITVNDCGLKNDFDAFNVDSVTYLDICKNDITDIENFVEKVTRTLFMDSYDGALYTKNGVYISVKNTPEVKEDIIEIKIPDENNLYMNFMEYTRVNQITNVSDIKINGKSDNIIKPIRINSNTTISYYARDLGNVKIKFVIDKNMKNDGIEVMYNPYLSRLQSTDSIDKNNIRAANLYGNGVFKETNDFELESKDIYTVPARVINKKLGTGSRTYIEVAEKYYSYIKQGNFLAKYTVRK